MVDDELADLSRCNSLGQAARVAGLFPDQLDFDPAHSTLRLSARDLQPRLVSTINESHPGGPYLQCARTLGSVKLVSRVGIEQNGLVI
jgi:hypothetical protein